MSDSQYQRFVRYKAALEKKHGKPRPDLPPDPVAAGMSGGTVYVGDILKLLMLSDEELEAHVGTFSAKFLRGFEEELWKPPTEEEKKRYGIQ